MSEYDEYVDYINTPENNNKIKARIEGWNHTIHSCASNITEHIFVGMWIPDIVFMVISSILVSGFQWFDNIYIRIIMCVLMFVLCLAVPFIISDISYRMATEVLTGKLYNRALMSITSDIPETERYLKEDFFIIPIYKNEKKKRIHEYSFALNEKINHSIKYYEEHPYEHPKY